MQNIARNDIVSIFGIQITNLSSCDCLARIGHFIGQAGQTFIATPNVDHIMKLQKDAEFREVYKHVDLVLADGMPLLWAARFFGTPLKEKISGSDLFSKLCEVASQRGWRLFFLGGREGAADKAAQVMRERHPGIQITGTYCPPFGFENDSSENPKIINLIQQAKPDILFVGLGAPKQEKWIYRHRDQYQVPVSIGIGVSFEFTAGMVKRAPLWMQKKGLEWFWRLIMEPRRLWKRYLIDDMQFFWLLLKTKLKRL
jgi:N-acetylglucosaminyldiphosphoundecaprenol N-acetyl-beta-D-mannosaminyltransferase